MAMQAQLDALATGRPITTPPLEVAEAIARRGVTQPPQAGNYLEPTGWLEWPRAVAHARSDRPFVPRLNARRSGAHARGVTDGSGRGDEAALLVDSDLFADRRSVCGRRGAPRWPRASNRRPDGVRGGAQASRRHRSVGCVHRRPCAPTFRRKSTCGRRGPSCWRDCTGCGRR